MSDTSVTVLGALELAGLVGLLVLVRIGKTRRAAGAPRAPRWLRIVLAIYAVSVVVGLPVVLVTSIVGRATRHERLREELAGTGTRATATILDLEETGTVYNRRPEVRVWLTVRPDHAPPFDAEVTSVFSVKDIQSYRVGSSVEVLFDPADHERVALVGPARDSSRNGLPVVDRDGRVVGHDASVAAHAP